LLVFSIVGIVIADARCIAACTTNLCGAPATGTGCHHQKGQLPRQCPHQHNLSQGWTQNEPTPEVPLPVSAGAAHSLMTPALDAANGVSLLPAAEQPRFGSPPLTSLRI
jgi:hypothetical protein